MHLRSPGIRPGRPLVILLGVWALIGFAAVWWVPAESLWRWSAILLAAALLMDLHQLLVTPIPRVTRNMRHTLPLGVWSRVRLVIEHQGTGTLLVQVHDLHPGLFEVRHLPRHLNLTTHYPVEIDYELRPLRRGDFDLPGCDLRLFSALRLWTRRRVVAVPTAVRVFPNFAEISRYTLLATADRLGQLGVRLRRRRGTGAEFHQLREYRRGDSLRQIDWNATSKVRKLVSREYQEERDQRLLFLLDCGRRMRHADAESGHLDDALNALLLLAYVAVHQGDAVGLMTYGGPRRWSAPRKDPDTVNRLLGAVYDLQPTLETADPLMAAQQLMQSLDRRALIVIITNTRDEDDRDMETAIRLLCRRHLVVLTDLREAALDQALREPVKNREEAMVFHAVQDYLETRRRHHERLQHSGAQVLDLLPGQLPIALVNRYLDIKRGGGL